MNQECSVCHGKLKRTVTVYTQQYQGQFIIIENVPAWVCEPCGETYYEPQIVEAIQALIWSGAAPVRTVQTPIYDLKATG